MDTTYYLIDELGNLRFTGEGLDELTAYFAKAGINIHTIKTLDAYHQARVQASPYFFDWLADQTREWPDTDQYHLLKTALFGTAEELEKATQRFDRKKTFRVIPGTPH